jgi:hypothetical protein
MGDASTARARTAPAARKATATKAAAPRTAAKKTATAARTPRKAAARKVTAPRRDPAPTEPTALAEAIAARQTRPGFDAEALLANSGPAPKKALPRKAAARKTAAKKAAPAPAAKKTAAKKTPRKAAAKKPVKRPSAAKAGTSRAKKFTRTVKYARKHPFTASLAVLLVVTTVAWRGVKGGGRLLKSGVTRAWAKGEDGRLNRRAAKKAAEATAAGHKGCQACKGTGVLPRHNADGTWAGSVRCTKSAARRAAARRSA